MTRGPRTQQVGAVIELTPHRLFERFPNVKLRFVSARQPEQKKIVLVTRRGCRHHAELIPATVPPAQRKVLHFDATVELEVPDVKKIQVIKDGEKVVDYRDVSIRGYLSTFANALKADRDGEYVMPGAFEETLKRFRTNPVMLIDHRNAVGNIAGSFTTAEEDAKGLYVEGMLSNAPGNIDVRFKLVERHLKTMSIGGIFHFSEDRRGIFKVDLFEGSLVAVPSNPEAIVSVREATEQEIKRANFLALQN